MSNDTPSTGEATGCCSNPSAPESSCCGKADEASSCCGKLGICCRGNLAMIYGAWLLRAWLGVRALQTGVEKWAGIKGVEKRIMIDGKPSLWGLEDKDLLKVYDLNQYHGVPPAMMESFKNEPLMPGFMLPVYDKVLGPVLLILGATVLLGIFPRTSLFLLGLLYVSLTWGLILLAQDGGIAWLGTHMILIVMALAMAKHNRLCLIGKW